MRNTKVSSDQKLFEKIKVGETKSFNILFDRYYQPLCNFAFLYLKNKEQIEEVVCDVFTKIWQKRSEIFIRESVKSYLYKSTRNAIVSYYRTKKLPIAPGNDELDKKDCTTPETLLLNRELEENIKKLLGGLPKKAGLVFRMKRVDGLKYKEIAEILDISEKTVENHITKAIKQIKLILDKNPELVKYFEK
ncbi:MAG: RNA polymerase sigma-70 factor [Bacteroidetes bacterium 4572_114]|nr:MAG: RNA polymerase sigma-70 factor [Bacteroidetes bacterium 4572_114]